jgi:chromosome segregation protein
MKIKKLELVGFKSFVDRTIINFDHDVMGIVGPNGCGKSNIVDAIRWCMGEQSAKHLRGRSMEDVIFNGSETRAAHEFAEVTLAFENDDINDLPLEYREYPEIAVTRRLHRSGESEYLINKTHVRLKDITDLFLGTGVGTKAYSIVEQGKIGLIVSAKAEDRRMLIEEAAGITKYKSRKKQAERKMEMTQQNLLRVGDIVAEIDRNLGSLKRQAAKAERYLAYKNEVEDLQLYEASHKYLELTAWTKLETGEVARCTDEFDRARTNLATREAELDAARQEALSAEEILEGAQNAHFAAENAVRTQEAAIERAKDKIAHLQTREAEIEADATAVEQERQRLDGERAIITEQVETHAMEEEARAAEMAAEDEKMAGLTEELNAVKTLETNARNASSSASSAIAKAEAELSGFDRRHAEMERRIERTNAEHADLEQKKNENTEKLQELQLALEEIRSGKVTTEEERAQAEEKLTNLRSEISGSERALDDAKNELAKKRSRLHALEEVLTRMDGAGDGVKSLLATGDAAICGLAAERFDVPQDLAQAVAGLLGGRLNDVVVRDAERGAELLEALAEAKNGRATVVPLHPRRVSGASATESSFPRLADLISYAAEDESLVRALFGEALVVSDSLEARLALDESPGAIVVTRTGTVFFPDGRISGGSGDEVAAGMLEARHEMRALETEVVHHDDLVSEALARHQALRSSISETQNALDRARQAAHNGELALVSAERDVKSVENEIASAERRLAVLDGERNELAIALEEAQGERAAAQVTLENARLVLEESSLALESASAQVADWQGQVDAQRQLVIERKVHLASARERLLAARGTMTRLERSIEELGERHKRMGDEMITIARTLGETVAQIYAHREELFVTLATAKEAEDTLLTAKTGYDKLRADLGEREANLKDLRTETDLAKEDLAMHEMALREREIAMQHLCEGVAEKFRGLILARVVGDFHLRPPPDEETRARIAELIHLLDRMGSVNLEAVRELAEAEERFTFYSTQKEDLDKALADLERAIAQMNRESKRLFAETFEQVNLKFQEIFPRMFRGGRASLRLTNPDDMLETGIDILAQPPGKKLSSIELMSGGEKALTAVSLIFAIFQIKPSPFCILDEVDAPLDEANVTRYNELVRSMTDRSQFILITHIKRTMQEVDVLYGVTMPESGVSKMVSVRVNEVAQKKSASHAGNGQGQQPRENVAVA